MSIKETVRRIKRDGEYNLSHIRDEGFFPWTQNLQTIRKIVKNDFWGENVLKAKISGTGGGTEYAIKGENIIKFLEKYGPGFMLGSGKAKQYGKNTAGDSSGGRGES